jgi:hypothetical protein
VPFEIHGPGADDAIQEEHMRQGDGVVHVNSIAGIQPGEDLREVAVDTNSSILGSNSSEEKPRPVLSSVTVPRMGVARVGRGIAARCSASPDVRPVSSGKSWLALCRALVTATAEDLPAPGAEAVVVRLTRVVNFGAQAALRAEKAGHHPADVGSLRKGRGAMTVHFEVAPLRGANATVELMQGIHARLELLSHRGRASEHFDTSLDAELVSLKIPALLDDVRAQFSRPRQAPAPAPMEANEATMVCFVLLFFVFCVVCTTAIVGAFVSTI